MRCRSKPSWKEGRRRRARWQERGRGRGRGGSCRRTGGTGCPIQKKSESNSGIFRFVIFDFILIIDFSILRFGGNDRFKEPSPRSNVCPFRNNRNNDGFGDYRTCQENNSSGNYGKR